MGNQTSSTPAAPTHTANVSVDREELVRNVTAVRTELEAQTSVANDAYASYRRLRVRRDAACQHPFLAYSQTLQDKCEALQHETIKAQLNAAEKTSGISLLLDLFEH